MQDDNEGSSAAKKAESQRDTSWIHRAFNPPNHELVARPRPPARIGDSAKLFASPDRTKKILSMVVGDKMAGGLVNIIARTHIQNGEALRQAALSNWFIQPETPVSFFDILKTCVEDEAAIRDAFATMMRTQIDAIRERLKNDFPRRAEILEEGFALHEEQRFFASIPLFLMMAEGIASEKTGKSIFSPGPGTEKGHKPPQIFQWLARQNLSPVARIYSGALQTEHPFSRGQLSRHTVLHGSSTDYGSEIFSLQAISILGLVGWIFGGNGLVSADRGT